MLPRTKAVPEVLRRGHEEKLARKILRVFGASTIDEALATYDAVGAAERASIDEVVERMTADAGAAFLLSVKERRRPAGWRGGVPPPRGSVRFEYQPGVVGQFDSE